MKFDAFRLPEIGITRKRLRRTLLKAKLCPAANKNQPFQSLLTRLGFEKHLIFGANSQGVKFIVGELNFLRGSLVEGLLTKVSNQPPRAPDGGQ